MEYLEDRQRNNLHLNIKLWLYKIELTGQLFSS